MLQKTNWKEQFKLRIADSRDEMQHHEVIKLLLMMKILNKNRRKNLIRLYTEFEFMEGRKCDIYFEDVKEKSIMIYEIQKDMNKKWVRKMIDNKEKLKIVNMKTDLIIVDMNKLSTKIEELNKQLDEYIF